MPGLKRITFSTMGEVYRKEIPIVAPEYRLDNDSAIARVLHEGGNVREVITAVYDVTGGDDGTVGAHGLGVYVPDNFIITKAWIDVITTFVDADDDSATIAVHVQSANDVVAAIAISDATNVWDAGLHGSKIGFPAIAGSTASDTSLEVAALFSATWLKTTARREVTVTVADDDLVAGKLVIYLEGVMGA